MKIAVIGTGYVGLVTGACLAGEGHSVICADIDEQKIENLKSNLVTIYEPGLTELVTRTQSIGKLSFTCDIAEAVESSDIIFIAVGTPQSVSGEADLNSIFAATHSIRNNAKSPKIVVIKSTVPPGTNLEVTIRLNQYEGQHQVVSNPEFLREGTAIADFLNPDRVIVGARGIRVVQVMRDLYDYFIDENHIFMSMTPESAEMTKYASNGYLAMRLSYINEIANLCERMGADITQVARGMAADERIGYEFLKPGIGYGGSCFPKDVAALIHMGMQYGDGGQLAKAAKLINDNQACDLFGKLLKQFDRDIKGRHIAVWGLAFKPGTDDVREAPSLKIIKRLLNAGAKVSVYDPQAVDNARRELLKSPRPPGCVKYCTAPYKAVERADALMVLTEWDEFRDPDYPLLKQLMKGRVILDGRNCLNPVPPTIHGFTYVSIGRAAKYPKIV